jgi:hypothetical protein
MQSEKYKIELDLDRDRIKSILSETYSICEDMLGVQFNITIEEFVGKINIFLDSNRVTIPVLLNLPSRQYPELKIEVDPRKKSVRARMAQRKKRIFLNRYLTKL